METSKSSKIFLIQHVQVHEQSRKYFSHKYATSYIIGEIIEDDIGIFIAAHDWVGKTKYMVSAAVSESVGDSVSTINIVAFQFQPYHILYWM